MFSIFSIVFHINNFVMDFVCANFVADLYYSCIRKSVHLTFRGKIVLAQRSVGSAKFIIRPKALVQCVYNLR